MDNMHAPNAVDELRKTVRASNASLEKHVDTFILNTNSALDALAAYHKASSKHSDKSTKKPIQH